LNVEKLEVFSPEGLSAVNQTDAAPRLTTLDRKRVAEIWNGVFKGDMTFPIIRELLSKKFPGIEIVPYTEFPHAPASDNPARQRELAREIALLVKEKSCDAVISGNGA
jgi:hypothetical protein